MNKKEYIKHFIKLYPILNGFTNDLLFFVAIDTLFLTIAKGLTATQIILLTTISSFLSIIFRFILIRILNRIGNTISVRIGAILLFVSSVILTFGTSFLSLLIGKIIYELSWIFKDMESVMLRNNLNVINAEQNYSIITNKAMNFYALITFVVAISSGFLFNINNYLPMFLCMMICGLSAIGYFFMEDVSLNNKTKFFKKESIINKTKILWLILIIYGLFYGIMTLGLQNSKLLLQNELSVAYKIEKVSLYLGIIVACSRISRLFGSIIFGKIYKNIKKNALLFLSSLLTFAFVLIICGNFINNLILKFVLIAIGFCLILSVRDPFTLYIQDTVFLITEKCYYQTIISYIQIAKKIGITLCGFIATSILLKWNLISIIFGIFFLSLCELIIIIRLNKIINKNYKNMIK